MGRQISLQDPDRCRCCRLVFSSDQRSDRRRLGEGIADVRQVRGKDDGPSGVQPDLEICGVASKTCQSESHGSSTEDEGDQKGGWS